MDGDPAMNLQRRLDALEAARARCQRREITAMAAEHGLTYNELMEEAEAFFSLSLEDQLARVDAVAADLQTHGMTWGDVEDIKQTLIRENRP
jgi:hypothetical protein